MFTIILSADFARDFVTMDVTRHENTKNTFKMSVEIGKMSDERERCEKKERGERKGIKVGRESQADLQVCQSKSFSNKLLASGTKVMISLQRNLHLHGASGVSSSFRSLL